MLQSSEKISPLPRQSFIYQFWVYVSFEFMLLHYVALIENVLYLFL